MGKLLVLYVFHLYNKRVDYFIKNALFKDDNVDFIIISNDKNNVVVVPDYVKTLHRDNIGYDFGGWSDALFTDNLYEKYDNFIFINSSVIGPFVPSYFEGRWTDIYINGLKEDVKLFGSTINTCGDPLHKSHVQSYIFSMDKPTLQYLMDCQIFSTTNYATTFNDAIWQKEVLMSRKILENNWNIGCLMKHYKNIDFTFRSILPEHCHIEFLDDIMLPQYRNVLWEHYEVVFIKGNRMGIH